MSGELVRHLVGRQTLPFVTERVDDVLHAFDSSLLALDALVAAPGDRTRMADLVDALAHGEAALGRFNLDGIAPTHAASSTLTPIIDAIAGSRDVLRATGPDGGLAGPLLPLAAAVATDSPQQLRAAATGLRGSLTQHRTRLDQAMTSARDAIQKMDEDVLNGDVLQPHLDDFAAATDPVVREGIRTTVVRQLVAGVFEDLERSAIGMGEKVTRERAATLIDARIDDVERAIARFGLEPSSAVTTGLATLREQAGKARGMLGRGARAELPETTRATRDVVLAELETAAAARRRGIDHSLRRTVPGSDPSAVERSARSYANPYDGADRYADVLDAYSAAHQHLDDAIAIGDTGAAAVAARELRDLEQERSVLHYGPIFQLAWLRSIVHGDGLIPQSLDALTATPGLSVRREIEVGRRYQTAWSAANDVRASIATPADVARVDGSLGALADELANATEAFLSRVAGRPNIEEFELSPNGVHRNLYYGMRNELTSAPADRERALRRVMTDVLRPTPMYPSNRSIVDVEELATRLRGMVDDVERAGDGDIAARLEVEGTWPVRLNRLGGDDNELVALVTRVSALGDDWINAGAPAADVAARLRALADTADELTATRDAVAAFDGYQRGTLASRIGADAFGDVASGRPALDALAGRVELLDTGIARIAQTLDDAVDRRTTVARAVAMDPDGQLATDLAHLEAAEAVLPELATRAGVKSSTYGIGARVTEIADAKVGAGLLEKSRRYLDTFRAAVDAARTTDDFASELALRGRTITSSSDGGLGTLLQ